MELADYQSYVWSIFKPELRDSNRGEIYLWAKLVSELGELEPEIFMSAVTGSNTKFIEELGDVAWYLVNLATLYKIKLRPMDGDDTFHGADGQKCFLLSAISTAAICLGEVCKKHYHDKAINEEELKVRLEDQIWELFIALAVTVGKTPPEVFQVNYDKLMKRHGEKYNKDFYKDLGSQPVVEPSA